MRILFFFLLSVACQGQVVINEITASNLRSFPNADEFEDYPDWIELFNQSGETVSLQGYCLSDDSTDLEKWPFPAGATIGPGEHLLVIADGYDSDRGVIYRRDYFGSRQYETTRYHTNFKLSSLGEEVLLTGPNDGDSILIPLRSEWKYSDSSTPPTGDWKALIYDDASWNSGVAPFGYTAANYDHPITEISFGGNANEKTITSYFRHQFEHSDLNPNTQLRISFEVDDGGVIYLNGSELTRFNLAPGAIGPNDTALTEASFGTAQAHLIDRSLLLDGQNILAVEVHQASAASPTMRFEADLAFTTTPKQLIDQITFPTQVDDISFGRNPSDPATWVYFVAPSPGGSNSGPLVSDTRARSATAVITPASGFFQDTVTISMDATAGEIRYTTDGANPSPDSPLYLEPFVVTSNTVVRAQVFGGGIVPGRIVTNSYFIGEESNGLPSLSLTAPSETLFGSEIGIYGFSDALGGNFHKGIDAPGHLEFFEANGTSGFSVNGGFRLGGENNFGSHAQKAFNFYPRGKYGDGEINYDLFPGSNISKFTALTIREGGDDWGKAHLSDPLFDLIARGRMEVETNRYRPAVLYINGEYWGLYNMRDRWDDQWFFQEYGTNDGAYDHIIFRQDEAENGSNDDWLELINFLAIADLTDPENWKEVEDRIDLNSLVDFLIAESYGRNSSWVGNREWWKDHRPGSKWRWFIPDMDRSFGNSRETPTLSSMLSSETTVQHLATIPQFRERLMQRAAAHMVDTLSEARVHQLIDQAEQINFPEIPRQAARWGSPTPSAYQASITRMKRFVTDRSTTYLDEIAQSLGVDDSVSFTLATSGEGTFKFAGIDISPQTFQMFGGIETEIEAIPAPGYRFVSWTGASGDAKTTILTAAEQVVTANFVPDTSTELSGVLSQNTQLGLANSPYIITSDLVVPAGITLTISPGVTLEFDPGVNLRVMGVLEVNGDESAKVSFLPNRDEPWGGVSFEQPETQSTLTHLVLRGASRGRNSLLYPSAISGLEADLEMDFVDIGASRGPLFFRGGAMVLRDSILDIPLTGDGLNVKQGRAETIRCTFTGNRSPDTDGVDYDGVIDGLIKDCRFFNFEGLNSDAVDIGEQSVNCLIEGNAIFYMTDKGVSVGQGSSVILRKNLIVGCDLGVAVKDQGSTVLVDQNTFVDCTAGVAAYEKNFASGGGNATVSNSIFSNCRFPATVDSYSSLAASYSLSDTLPIAGSQNLLTDPGFRDPESLNYELLGSSPAIDAGDPTHSFDPDGTRVDIGARYFYSESDYPFDTSPTVVINEILANSGGFSDWIELHNRTSDPVDISGWFLSDNRSQLKKYRIPPGTIISAGGYLLFDEAQHFGEASEDSGRLDGFALSDTGETLFLTSATAGQLTSYRFEEDFGPSFEGRTIGYHYKKSSDSFNFVSLDVPTPLDGNSLPEVGPIVISEIMYNDPVEYLELHNISKSQVSFYDSGRSAGWRIDRGIKFKFTSEMSITLDPGERLILAEDVAAFAAKYSPAPALKTIQWTSGKLDNSGETVQLDRPGPVGDLGSLTYVRVDRVKYDDSAPWDPEADGSGLSLARINESKYGNDFINWIANPSTPGEPSTFDTYEQWAVRNQAADPYADPDRDGLGNLLEYALGRDPRAFDSAILEFEFADELIKVSFVSPPERVDVELSLQISSDLKNWQIIPMQEIDSREVATRNVDEKSYFRFHALQE